MPTSTEPSTSFRSGFIGIIGRPNVGKSTLLNALIGQKIAAVSPRPQTTRRRQMGILTLHTPPSQMIFIDSPGYHTPHTKLGELMNHQVIDILAESDQILLVADVSQSPHEDDFLIFELLHTIPQSMPIILGLNKMDLVDMDVLERNSSAFKERFPQATYNLVCATLGNGIPELTQTLLKNLPECPPFFPEEQLTDLYERDLAADLIREAALSLLRDEVPHGIAVRIDQFLERGESRAYVEATLFVERESHKPIVIGQGGKMLKEIGSTARKEIEALTNRKIYLALKVKVRPNWRNDDVVLRRFGFQ